MNKILPLLLSFLLIAQPVFATKQVLTWGGSNNSMSSTIEYNTMTGGNDAGSGQWISTEINRISIIPSAGTLSNLRARVHNTVDAGDTRTFTVRINRAGSSLACTVTDASSQACTDTGTLNVSAGDEISIETSQTGNCCAGGSSFSLLFDSTDTGATILMGGSNDDPSISGGRYFALHGVEVELGTSVNVQTIFPLAGVLRNLYVESENTIGSGNTLTITIVDSADSATAIACTLTNAGGTTCTDTSSTQSVSVNDRFVIKTSTSGTDNTHGAVWWGVELTATTEGQFGIYSTRGNNVTASVATEYSFIQIAGSGSWNTTVNNRDNQWGQTATIQAASVFWDGTNGSGDSMVFTLQSGTLGSLSDSDIAITLSEGENVEADSGSITGTDDLHYAIKVVPTTPDSNGVVSYAFRGFIDAGAADPSEIYFRGGTGGMSIRGGTGGIAIR